MIKALFKKQMAEVFSWLFMDGKKKTRRTGKGKVGFLLLYGLLFAYLGGFFFLTAKTMCEVFVPLGLTWFYFVLSGLVALVLGIFGSVFNTYASLYLAKDNDTLLAMPIPPRYILLARLSGVYVSGLFYEMLVMLPAILAWLIFGKPTVLGAILALLIPLVLSLLVLALSCLLGLLVAAVAVRIKRRSLVVTVVSLSFLVLYFWGYSRIVASFTDLLANAGEIAEKVKGPLFPFYHMGLAAEGKAGSFLIFAGIVSGVLLAVLLLLSHSFLALATTNKGVAKKAYKRERATQKSVGKALLGREFKRFLSSSVYMLNCGLGALFLPIMGIAMLIFRADIAAMLPLFEELLGGADVIPLILAAVACMMGSMLYITAPSISLEGKHLWILQSLPVAPVQVLYAKLKTHLLISVPSTAVAVACMLIAVPPSLPFFFLIPAAALLFAVLVALFGLFMNLKAPNFNWTSEVAPVKQSMSVTVTLFGGWGLVAALGALYVPLHGHVPPALYLGLVCAVLTGLCAWLFLWLRTKGAAIFAAL